MELLNNPILFLYGVDVDAQEPRVAQRCVSKFNAEAVWHQEACYNIVAVSK